jgi:hypothetical protein
VPPESPEAMANAFRTILAMSPAERQAMGERGRVYVEKNFDMRTLGRQMEQLMLQASGDARRNRFALRRAGLPDNF